MTLRVTRLKSENGYFSVEIAAAFEYNLIVIVRITVSVVQKYKTLAPNIFVNDQKTGPTLHAWQCLCILLPQHNRGTAFPRTHEKQLSETADSSVAGRVGSRPGFTSIDQQDYLKNGNWHDLRSSSTGFWITRFYHREDTVLTDHLYLREAIVCASHATQVMHIHHFQ